MAFVCTASEAFSCLVSWRIISFVPRTQFRPSHYQTLFLNTLWGNGAWRLGHIWDNIARILSPGGEVNMTSFGPFWKHGGSGNLSKPRHVSLEKWLRCEMARRCKHLILPVNIHAICLWDEGELMTRYVITLFTSGVYLSIREAHMRQDFKASRMKSSRVIEIRKVNRTKQQT